MPWRRGSAAHRDLHSNPLARELTFALAAKIAALILIWLVFFRAAPMVDPARLFAPAAPPRHEAQR